MKTIDTVASGISQSPELAFATLGWTSTVVAMSVSD
jgi:hypothetical protein